MRIFFTILIYIVILSACRLKISGSEKRLPKNIKGGSAATFKDVMAHGKIINEVVFDNYRFIVVKKIPGNQPYFFIEEFTPRKNFNDSNYKREIQVYLLSDSSKNFFTINASAIKSHPAVPLQQICSFINSTSIAKDFTLFEVFAKKSDRTIYRGLFIEKIPCEKSTIEEIDNSITVKEGYINNLVNCMPNSDSLIAGVKDGKIIFWKKIEENDVAIKKNKNNKNNETNDDKTGFLFPYSCTSGNTNFNFTVELKFGKNGKVYIHNNVDYTKTAEDSIKIPIAIKDTTFSILQNKVIVKSDTTLRGDSVSIKMKAVTDTISPYNYGFEPINYYSYLTWVKKLYPHLNNDCADNLAYIITQQILLHDTAYFKCMFCKENTQKKDGETDSKKEAKANSVKSGSVKIVNTPATIMHPVYSSKNEKNDDIISLQFQLNGGYDSSANQVTFEVLDSTLPNNVKILDSTITISKNDWNNALVLNGLYNKEIKVSITSIKDTITNIRKGYIVIKGQSDQGQHEIQITPSQYNPNKPFWVEVGSNFDFIDGLEPNNFFSGVFFHKRDIRPFLFDKKKNNNLGLFAGVFESKTISTLTETDTLLTYHSSNSIALRRNDSLGLFRDTGVFKTAQVVRNVGLFFSPQIRLSKGSANENGMHFFASFWGELQWQRLSLENDYSGLMRKDTIFRPLPELNRYGSISADKKQLIDVKTHYIGLGFPIYFKEDDVNVFFNPVFGFSSQPSSEQIKSVFSKISPNPEALNERPWKPFYIFQFRLNEEKYGIAFTGEVRGLLIKRSPPFVSLALSKKFDLSKFIEFK